MKIVSLDQVAISILERKGETDAIWKEILTRLLDETEAGRAICPIPDETVWETAFLPTQPHDRVKSIQSRLSQGVHFKSFQQLLAEEVLALVRPGIDLTPWNPGDWETLRRQVVGSASLNDLKLFKKSVETQFNERVIDRSNENLRYPDLLQHIRKKFTLDLYHNLDRLKTTRRLITTCPYTAFVCEFLGKNDISGEEIEQLKKLVLRHKYWAIPILFYYCLLVARLEFDLLSGGARKPKVNDEVDLSRTATALGSADAYICEVEMAETCKKAKVSDYTHVRVFSVRETNAILGYLNQHAS